MMFKNLLLLSLILSLGISIESNAKTPMIKKSIPSIKDFKVSENKPENKNIVSYYSTCSCRSYYGVPHSCYYSPYSDPDYSCYSKCIREANQ